jgi:hypothetical protein
MIKVNSFENKRNERLLVKSFWGFVNTINKAKLLGYLKDEVMYRHKKLEKKRAFKGIRAGI